MRLRVADAEFTDLDFNISVFKVLTLQVHVYQLPIPLALHPKPYKYAAKPELPKLY